MKDRLVYYSNPTMDDFYDVFNNLKGRFEWVDRPYGEVKFVPRPSFIINGIDFNERLDIELQWLHFRIKERETTRKIVEIFKECGILIWRRQQIFSPMWERGMQVAWPKNPFIIGDPQA